jgi:hypothetical protein
MKPHECILILKDKLNKLNTNFSADLQHHTAVRVINESISYWYDERLRLEDATKVRQREIQHLIKSEILSVIENTVLYNAYNLPFDFLQVSLINTEVSNACSLNLVTFLIENSNVGIYLNDEMSKPDYDWEQTFATLRNNKLVIYKDTLENLIVTLHYYKKVNKFDIVGYTHLDNTLSTNVDLEFEGSSAYEILDIAAKIIAGNINDIGRTQHNQALSSEYK